MLTPAALKQVSAAVRAALRAEAGREPGWTWPAGEDAAAFLETVHHHRVHPLLAAADDALGLPVDIAATLRAWRDADRLRALGGQRVLASVELALAGIDHLVIKGAPLAVQTTGDPTGRGPGDVDLLVAPGDLGGAVDRLLADGWSGRSGSTVDQATWAWRHQQRVTYELGLERGRDVVDLHWRLDPTVDGLPGFAEVWERREVVAVGGSEVATLGGRDLLAHALRNVAKDSWGSLRSLVDIHRLLRDPARRLRDADLDALDRASLAVTAACVGLPDGVPVLPASAADLERATTRQLVGLHEARFAGDNISRHVRYGLRSSRTPRDLARLLDTVLLPPFVTADITERRAVPAVAAALARRVRRLGSSVHGETS